MSGKKALIIGYGNPLRGDDGVGQIVAEAIRAHELADAHDHRLPSVDSRTRRGRRAIGNNGVHRRRRRHPGRAKSSSINSIEKSRPRASGTTSIPARSSSSRAASTPARPRPFSSRLARKLSNSERSSPRQCKTPMPAVVAAVIRLVRGSEDASIRPARRMASRSLDSSAHRVEHATRPRPTTARRGRTGHSACVEQLRHGS